MVQQRGGIDGVSREQVRTLLLEVGGNAWVCADGQQTQWTSGPVTPAAPLTRKVPVAEVANYGGIQQPMWGRAIPDHHRGAIRVRDEVAIGPGAAPCAAATPGCGRSADRPRGLIHLPLVVTGADTQRRGR